MNNVSECCEAMYVFCSVFIPVLILMSFSFPVGSLTLDFVFGGNLVGDSCRVEGGSEEPGT